MTDHSKSDVSKLVRVMQLKWEEVADTFWSAQDPFNTHYGVLARPDGSGSWYLWPDGHTRCENVDAAKAAAQADFESRILARLTARKENE